MSKEKIWLRGNYNMAKIPEAQNRLFKNVFVCKKCQSKMKAKPIQILEGKVKCRNCGKKAFRPVKKKWVL